MEEKELDEFMEDWSKQVTQEDKIDESVEDYLGEMGWLWTTVLKKLENDKFCVKCKKNVEFTKQDPPHVVQAGKTDEGVVAFVSLCNKCYAEEEKKLSEKTNEENKDE